MIKRLALLFCLAFPFQGQGFHVVTSIVPLQSLASWLLDGLDTPGVLLDGFESAHTYALRPSDMKNLYQADMIFWIGPTYEGFLGKALASSKKPVVALIESPGLDLLTLNNGHGCSHHCHDADHSHHQSQQDPHFWLDPRRCKKILIFMHQEILKVLPQEKQKLDANLQAGLQEMDRLFADLQKKFAGLKGKPFMVYHDGYRYLQDAFNLNGLGPVTNHPDIPMTLEDKRKFLENLQQNPTLCVFTESQFSPKNLKDMQEILPFKLGNLDPIGIGLTGKLAYGMMMTNLATAMEECLTP
jgi:zinc transport system substrate-binding protein